MNAFPLIQRNVYNINFLENTCITFVLLFWAQKSGNN